MSGGKLLLVETPAGLRRRALGGAVIRVSSGRLLARSELQALRDEPFVKERDVTVLPDYTLQIVVNDTAEAMPVLLSWFKDRDIEVEKAGEYNPPFDDVFVSLVEQETNGKEANLSDVYGRQREEVVSDV
jgi:ABC-2 type transport system ATP-binding protein